MLLLDRKILPDIKQERWRYTPLKRALGDDLLSVRPLAQEEIFVDGGVKDIVFFGENAQHHQPFLKVVLAAGTRATVIERHEGKGAYWKNMSTEIVLEENAQLNHIRIQEDSLDSVQTNMAHVSLAENALLNCFSFNLGGKLTRHDVHCVLNGSGAQCYLNGVNLLRGKQHGDTTILMEHVAPRCTSSQFYRSVLDEQAHGVLQGKIHVHRVAQKSDGYQGSNSILLSPDARMNTKPELEIYADDVKCSHGATTGKLDESALFYLRSRGLDEWQARRLLVRAFVDEIINKLADKDVRVQVREMLGKWLIQQLK